MKYSAVVFDWGGTLGIHKVGLAPYVPNLFRDLFESGYRLGVLSNSCRYGDARWLRRKLADHKMAEFVECVVGTGGILGKTSSLGSAGCHKPDPAVFQRVLNFLGVPAHRTVYVGDSFKHDILASSSLGMGSLQVDSEQGDWGPALWNVLRDDPANKRFNVLTSYAFLQPNTIKFQVRHLTKQISVGSKVVVGLEEYEVLRCLPHANFTKDEIVHGKEESYLTIQVEPL